MEHRSTNDPELPEVRLTQDTWLRLAAIDFSPGEAGCEWIQPICASQYILGSESQLLTEAKLLGKTAVASTAQKNKTKQHTEWFISIWSRASPSPCDIIPRQAFRGTGSRKLTNQQEVGRIQEQRGGRRRARRAARTRTHGRPSGTLTNKHLQSHIYTLRKHPCAKISRYTSVKTLARAHERIRARSARAYS